MVGVWYEDEGIIEGTHRLLLTPSSDSDSDSGGGDGKLIQLRHPKTGESTCYMLINNNHNNGVYEVNWFKQSYSSSFIQDFISQHSGGFYAATPVDPLFLLLPIFHQARFNNNNNNNNNNNVHQQQQQQQQQHKKNDPGMFTPLDDILYIPDYPSYHHHFSHTSMELLCDSKQIGSTKFFRLNDDKVLAWLYCKVQQLKQTLINLDNNYSAQTHKDTLADVVMILGEYLADDPWLNLLSNNLGLHIDEAILVPDPKIHLPTKPKIDSSFTPIQEGRVTRSGKQTKKAKVVEKNSHNIKDMFNRASRKGR